MHRLGIDLIIIIVGVFLFSRFLVRCAAKKIRSEVLHIGEAYYSSLLMMIQKRNAHKQRKYRKILTNVIIYYYQKYFVSYEYFSGKVNVVSNASLRRIRSLKKFEGMVVGNTDPTMGMMS